MKNTKHRSRLLLGLMGLTALIACQKPDEIVLDSTPEAFNFIGKTAVPITGTDEVESDPVTISGINTPANVTVSNGKYGIDNAACTAAAGTISNGQKLRLCAPRPKTAGAESIVTVTVGGISSTFNASAEPPAPVLALTPTAFNAQVNVNKNVTLTSNELTVSGIVANLSVPVSLSAPIPASAKLFVNDVLKTSPSSVKNNDKIKVSITSASTDSTVSNVSLKVGEVGKELTAIYSVRTAGALGANEFAPLETLTDYQPVTGENSPVAGFVVPDTTPTCKYGTSQFPGPWRKATAAEIALGDIDFFYRGSYEFKKSNSPKSGWNNCPENWDEAAILAAGDAGLNIGGELRKFGKTSLSFNVAGAGNVSKVELKLKLAHQSRADLLMTLVSPNGTRVLIYDMLKDSQNNTIRGSQFSNPNTYAGGMLYESTGISIIFDDAAVSPPKDTTGAGASWTPAPGEMATLRYRCGQNNRFVGPLGNQVNQTGNWLGACWDNSNADQKANFPGKTGFGSFARVLPSNPLSAFQGQPITGTWKLEIEDRATGNQESNDDAFPPFRPLDLAGESPKNDFTTPTPKSVTAVAGDDKKLVRQPTNALNNIPKLRVAILTVK
jgi:Proprotein convertase P-domain